MRADAALLFPDDFDAMLAPAAPPEAEPPPPPSYDQAALDAACAAARAEGHAEGRAEAEAGMAARVAEAIARIAEGMQAAEAAQTRMTEQGVMQFARLLLAGLVAGYPLLGARFGEEELRKLIRRAMPGMLQERRVTFQVHPTMAAAVAAEIAAVPERERAHMVVEPTERIPPGDAHIVWPDGGLRRDTVAVAAAVADVLRPLGLLPDDKDTETP